MLTQRFDSAARLQRLHDLQAQQWFAQPHGQQLLEAAQPLLEEALAGLFGGYLVHCGPAPQACSPRASSGRCAWGHRVRLRRFIARNMPGRWLSMPPM